MIQAIPLDPTATFVEQRVSLDGVDYILKFYFAQRDSVYYMSIFDITETALVVGIKLIVNMPLIVQQQAYNIKLPTGNFIVLSFDQSTRPPTFGELGLQQDGCRCSLCYVNGTDQIITGSWYA